MYKCSKNLLYFLYGGTQSEKCNGLGILEFKFADEYFGLNIQMMAAELYYAVMMPLVNYFPKLTPEFYPKRGFSGSL